MPSLRTPDMYAAKAQSLFRTLWLVVVDNLLH